jgi:hypothetical protein
MEPNTQKPERAGDVGSTRLVSRLRGYLRDMDCEVRMRRVAIKELTAAADQMEKDKLTLDLEVDRIEKEMANALAHRWRPLLDARIAGQRGGAAIRWSA